MKNPDKPDDIEDQEKDLPAEAPFDSNNSLKNTDSKSKSQTCVLCKQPIAEPSQRRTLHYANKEFSTHQSCLEQLHNLLRSAFNIQPPTPTLHRKLTLAEYLLTKRPQNETEILACIAYYLQFTKEIPHSLSVQEVTEHLRYTGFKIPEPDAAFKQAANQGFFEPLSQEKDVTYKLTEKGIHLVEQLPSPER